MATPEGLEVKRGFLIESAAPLGQIWGTLDPDQKLLAYHLQRAARAGRDLLFFQNHRHGLLIRDMLEAALSKRNFKNTRGLFEKRYAGLGPKKAEEAFDELLKYFIQFEDQGGPYSESNRKIVLKKVLPIIIKDLLVSYNDFKNYPIGDQELGEIQDLLTHPQYEALHRPEEKDGKDLQFVGGNLYQKGITGSEVEAAVAKGLKIELNCRIVRTPFGLACQKLTTQTPGPVGVALKRVNHELNGALKYSKSTFQKKEIEAFIRYFEFGAIEDFRQANIAWVQDRSQSQVDFMMGFVETYTDHRSAIGSWESYVQIVDPTMTEISKGLAGAAQYFEDRLPYGRFKKKFPADYSPPALMVYYFQEIAHLRSGGYNLPNFDDIRQSVGAKNIIRLSLEGEANSPELLEAKREAYKTFGPSEKVEHLLKWFPKQRQVLVLLHEIMGHGSGTYDETKFGPGEDPASALGVGGEVIEEQRADLAALVFADDPVLVKTGVYATQEEARLSREAMYDLYLIDFLRLLSRQKSFSEPHMRGHWLLVKSLLDDGAIEWTQTPQGPILTVRDYDAFWKCSYELLGTLQDIKANRKEADLAKLLAQKAPLSAVQEPWAQEVIARGRNLKLNYGSVQQNWLINHTLEFSPLGAPTVEGIAQSASLMGYDFSFMKTLINF